VKDAITALAFSKGYTKYRLADIYTVKRSDGEFGYKTGHTAEEAGGRNQEITDFKKLSDKEEHELAQSDPEAYGRYLKEGIRQSSKFVD